MTIELPQYNFAELYPNDKMLSSTQFLTYLQDPARFFTEYNMGVRKKETPAMQVGQIFSALYADRNYPAREALAQVKAPKRIADLFDRAMTMLPVLPAEIPCVAEHRGWKFRATLDGYAASDFIVVENKTGQKEWTQERVNFDNQITFQAWCHWKKHGVIPKKILLNWVSTASGSTQTIVTFKTSRTVKGLQMFERMVDLVIDGIESKNFTEPVCFV